MLLAELVVLPLQRLRFSIDKRRPIEWSGVEWSGKGKSYKHLYFTVL